MKLSDNKVYTCPECDSECLSVSMRCSVNPNTNDIDVDWESDVGDSDKWTCEECGNSGFLPKVKSIDGDDDDDDDDNDDDDDDDNETLTCDLCGRRENEDDAIAEGWIPEYINEEGHTCIDPVCVECCAARITTNEDGDNELIKTAL